MTEDTPKLSRGKAKAALQALSRGKRDAKEADIRELYPYGLIAREPRNPAYDRDVVISATAALEQTLEEAILTKFELRTDADQMLFLDTASPLLRDFYDKCRMAYLLGIIGKNTLHDLSVIRHVRNAFAHTRGHLDLDMPEFQEMLAHITVRQRIPRLLEHSANKDLRELFIQTTFELSMYLALGHTQTQEEAGKIMAERQRAFRQ